MRQRLSLTCLAWAIGLSYAPWTQAVADQALAYAVALEAPEAQRMLLENNLDLYRWRGSERMDEAQLRRLVDQAPDQIQTLLATEGYYSPKVEATLGRNDAGWTVHLSVWLNEPVKVSQVELQAEGPINDGSATNLKRLARIRADWKLSPGKVFRHVEWEDAKREALRNLLLESHPAAAIKESQATVDSEAKTAQLKLVLDSGPAFTFGQLQILGLRRYPSSVIERLSPIQPGAPYSQAKLLTFQSLLQDSPYFTSVNVHMDTNPKHPLNVPVQVSVEEQRARSLGLGLGGSTDTGPRAQMDYRDINFLGEAWRLSSTLKLAQKEQSLTGELNFPKASRGYQDSINAQWSRADREGETLHTLALGAKRSRTRGKIETSYSLSYFNEQQAVDGSLGDSRSALIPSWSWTRHDVDNVLYPSRGTLITVQTDAAAKALLSDQSFFRGYGKVVWLHPLGDMGQLILRSELGAVAADSRDGIPSDFLFRTGGDQTVRGYAYRSLGVSEGDAIVGGRWLAVVSGEYVHWLNSAWGAAVFIDAGDAADSLGDLDLVLGYGLGARWKSPVGPLGLDLAHGQATGENRLHFSVGVSF